MNTSASQVVSNATEDIPGVLNGTVDRSKYWPYDHHFNNADDIYFYSLGVVIPFGLIGNVFSICIFLLSPILRRTTTGQYLVALAIADTTVLVGELLRWFAFHKDIEGVYYLSRRMRIWETSLEVCRITMFLRYGGCLCSAWLTVAIAVERTIAVAFPLKISNISTLLRSRIVIVVLTIVCFSLALFSFWEFDIDDTYPEAHQCKTVLGGNYAIWNNVTIKLGTLAIPGVLIVILTLLIIVLLYGARKKRMSQLALSVRGTRDQQSSSELSTETQLTIMLVAVCIAATAIKIPYAVAYQVRTICWDDDECDTLKHVQTYVAYRVTEIFNVLNYAINFFLYCLSGSSFREQIRAIFCRVIKTRNSCSTHQTSLETTPTSHLESGMRLLKTTPRASPSSIRTTNNI